MDLMMNDAQKYEILIVNKINYRLAKWNTLDYIFEREIYLFLNKVIDAAKVIHLKALEDLAGSKLKYISGNSTKQWSRGKWKAFLKDILIYAEQSPDLGQLAAPQIKEEDEKIILLIDDDFEFITHLKSELEKNGYHVIIALNAEKGLEVFYTMNPLFVLLNINLRDAKELFDFKQIMEVAQSIFTPIVLISEQNNEENRIAAYSVGANDFIAKPINLSVFIPYLKNRIEYRERILESITIDELTKTYNRKHMNHVLQNALNNYKQHNVCFSIAMIDLDHFKKVNDQYGHLIGDRVLEKMSAIIKDTIRGKGLVFRYGGEEFLMYLPQTTAVEASNMIDVIRSRFNSNSFKSGDHEFTVTFSAGISTIDHCYASIVEMVDDTDKALYESKESGRNKTTIYSKKAPPVYYKTLTVIIVDDDRLYRTMLEDAFNNWQLDDVAISVQTYQNGEDFLSSSWYEPNENYLILLDGVMPQMDGVEVLARIRNNYPEEAIVISMLTARSGEENIVKALIKGADDYMIKSINVKEIMARSETLVRRMKL